MKKRTELVKIIKEELPDLSSVYYVSSLLLPHICCKSVEQANYVKSLSEKFISSLKKEGVI